MELNQNVSPVDVIKRGAFGGTYYGIEVGTSLRFRESKG